MFMIKGWLTLVLFTCHLLARCHAAGNNGMIFFCNWSKGGLKWKI